MTASVVRPYPLLLSFAAAALVARMATAQPALERAKTTGVTVVSKSEIASNPSHSVRVAGRGTMTVSAVADRVFAKSRELSSKLSGAKAVLLDKPVVAERYTETTGATLFVSTTSITVTDAAGLRKQVPQFASYHSGISGRGTFSASELKGEAKKQFESFKTQLAQKPARHPLSKALAKGDDALLDAIARGEGDITITITASIPKEALPVKNGSLHRPQLKDGVFDDLTTSAWSPKRTPTRLDKSLPIGQVRQADIDPGEHGKKKFVGHFVTGFTEDNEFEWEERWDFPSGFFSVGVGAYYAFGLRVPIEVTATLDPIESVHLIRDAATEATTTLRAKPVDGSRQFYLDAGLSKDHAQEGEELLLEAGAYATVRLQAGWGAIKVNETFPKNLGFDFSQNFEPPFGDCGTRCGFDVWIPTNQTKTGINVLGLVEGGVQLGFNISGKGTVGLDYSSLFDGKLVESKFGARSATHRLEWSAPGDKVVSTTLPPLPSADNEAYGYRLAAPKYDWKVTVTPGVKGTVEVNARPFFTIDEVIGPFWLPFLDVNLGTVELSAHKGSNTQYDAQPGRKVFKEAVVQTSSPLPPGAAAKRPQPR
jgi:hypothetical protein